MTREQSTWKLNSHSAKSCRRALKSTVYPHTSRARAGTTLLSPASSFIGRATPDTETVARRIPNYKTRSMADFLEFEEKHDCETNCRGLSIMLADILRSQGSQGSAPVPCMPYEVPFNDCHVVVDCFLPSGKRVMFDPHIPPVLHG